MRKLLFATLIVATGSTFIYAKTTSGLVVEDAAGDAVRQGDVITGYVSDAPGADDEVNLDSPFDLYEATQHKPVDGKARLKVQRDGAEISVPLTADQKLEVRPRFEGDHLARYEAARRFLAENKFSMGIHQFQELAVCLFREDELEAGAWVLSEVGRNQARANAWQEVAQTIADGDRSLESNSRVKAQFMEAAGKLYEQHNKYTQAGEFYQRALKLRRAVSPDQPQALTYAYERLGRLAHLPGDYNRAFGFFQESLDIRDRYMQDESEALANLLNNMGKVAMDAGNKAEAEDYFRRAYHTALKTGTHGRAYAEALQSLAMLAADSGQRAYARNVLNQALEAEPAADPVFQAETLRRMAESSRASGCADTADAQFARAGKLLQDHRPDSLEYAELLRDRGALAVDRAAFSEAERYFHQALAIAEKTAPNQPIHARLLHALGNMERRRTHPEAAVRYFDQAHHMVELLAENGVGNAEEQAAFSADLRSFYRDHIAALVDLGRSADAFGISEKFRARTLLHTLAGRRASADAGRLDTTAPLAPSATLNAVRTVALLPGDTAVLSYMMAESDLYIFALTSQGTSVVRVPATHLTREVADLRRYMMSPGSDTAADKLDRLSRKLGHTLLQPVAAVLKDHPNLVVLPDGPLHALPFAALRAPGPDRPYLAQTHVLTIADSATTYHLLNTGERPFLTSGFRWVGFGAPRTSDPDTLKAHRRVLTGFEQFLETGARRGPELQPLPYSALEIDEIADIFHANSWVLRGPQAFESVVRDLAPTAEILHFAGHGVFDADDPEASALVLAADPGTPGPGGDGRLTAAEITLLDLHADLVVLSACESGLGKDQAGEGAMSLARAFRYAGARSVLASLWRVSDLSTTMLMKRFYTNLLTERSTARALSRAQRSMIASAGGRRDLSHPYYWAPFQLLGTDPQKVGAQAATPGRTRRTTPS